MSDVRVGYQQGILVVGVGLYINKTRGSTHNKVGDLPQGVFLAGVEVGYQQKSRVDPITKSVICHEVFFGGGGVRHRHTPGISAKVEL